MARRKQYKPADLQKAENYDRHLLELFTLQLSQFEYTGLPDTLPAEFLELYLLINGTVAIGHVSELDNDDIYCAIGSYNGDYNGYLPDSYTAAVTGLGEINGKWGTDIVVGLNNNTRSPEYDIAHTASVLTEIDVSEYMTVIFARLSRLPYADTDAQKIAIENAIKAIIKGDVYGVVNRAAKDAFENFIEGGTTEKDKFLDLVDPDKIKNLQYLNQYRDNKIKQFLMRRGYMFNTTTKLAQQSTDEIRGSETYSYRYPMEQLRCRQKMCDDINRIFGTDISVDYNPILKKLINDYLSDDKKEDQDNNSDQDDQSDGINDNNNDKGGDNDDQAHDTDIADTE